MSPTNARRRRGRAIKRRRAIWTTTARADVVEDHDYIALFNPAAADQFIFDIFAKVSSIASLGLTGVARPEYGEDLSAIAYRERIFFFRVSETELTVVRVLHGHQEISPEDFLNIRD